MKTIEFNPIPILFNQEEHTYLNTETGAYLNGITGTLIHRLDPDKYKGVSKKKMKERSDYGSKVHEQLELIETIGIEPSTEEGANYLRLKEKHHLHFLASEITVSDLEHYATNIDSVYTDDADDLVLADYKTTSKFDRELTGWQLSIGAYFLELNNPGMKVKRLVGFWLRESKAEFFELPRRSDDEVKALIEADINDQPFTWQPLLPEYLVKAEDELYGLELQIKALTERRDALKADVLQQMVERGDKSIDSGRLLVTVIQASTRETFDSKKFKAEHADLYGNYIKQSTTKESLKLTIR